MSNDPRKPLPAVAQRKRMLIEQGARYRAGIGASKDLVRTNLQMNTLAKNAISHLAANASVAFGGLFNLRNFRNGNAQALLPLLISSLSFFSKRRILIKPAIVAIGMLAAVGTLAFFVSRKNRRAQSAEAGDEQGADNVV